jgi:putative selenium metabolism hydrolase
MFSLSSTETEALSRLACDLVRTPSPSGSEGAVAAVLSEAMRWAGFQEVWTDRVGNVVGRYGAGRGAILLFDGHMDTVSSGDPAAWLHDPFGGIVEDGILHGRGAADMKSALAAMVFGVKLLSAAGVQLQGDLYVAFVVQEEPCEGMAVRVLIEDEGLQPDYVILGEPTNLGLAIGQRGRMELEVTTYGRAGHAGVPQQGVNAIYGAARVVFGIELLGSQLLNDSVLGQGSVTVTDIASSAVSRNAIPDRCTLVVDRRLTLGDTEARAISEIQQILKREGIRGDVSTAEYEIASYSGYVSRGRKVYPPWVITERDELVTKATRAVQRALGVHPRLSVWPFSTDGAYTMGVAGIPTIGFGPGEERQAHSTDEQVKLADIGYAARGYAQMAVELLSTR